MGVRMMGQCRSPGGQHGSEPNARAEVLGGGRDDDQGVGSGLEQEIIEDRLVLIGDVGDRSGQGEDDMEIEMLWGERRGQGIIVAVNATDGDAPCRSQMTSADRLPLWIRIAR